MRRARIIFSLFLLLTALTVASAVDAESKTGSLKKAIAQPVKQFLADMSYQDTTQRQKEADEIMRLIATSSAAISKTQSTTAKTQTQLQQKGTAYPPLPTYAPIKYSNDSYEQALKRQEEWYKAVQEENRKLSEQSAKDLEAFKQSGQKSQTEFAKQAQQGLEDFRKESEAKMEEFKKLHAIP